MTDRPYRVLVLNQFALPRTESGGTRHVELFGRLQGWEHLIIAGNRNNYSRKTFEFRSPEFVTVPTTSYSSNGPARIVNWMSYVVGSFFVGLRQRDVKVVYASSPHLLTPFGGWLLAKVKRAKFVLEIRDPHPKVFVDLGYLREGSFVHRVLSGLERFYYKKAARIVSTSAGYSADVAAAGGDVGKFVPVTNGAEPSDFVPSITRAESREKFGFSSDAFVGVFAGAHGPKDGLDIVLDAAALLPSVTFALIGDGMDKPKLVSRARDEGLTNVRFLEPVPKRELANLFVGCDFGLHTMAALDLFRALSSNKFHDYLAARLPVVSNVPGEVEEILAESGGGLSGIPKEGEDNGQALADAISELRSRSAEVRAEMGRNGQDWVQRNSSRTVMSARLQSTLDAVVGR